MQKRASMTWVAAITKCPSEDPLATVGKPYKLPDRRAVCGEFLVPNKTLCGFRNRADSTWGGRRLFDSHRPISHECAPTAREVPHFGQPAKPPKRHLLGRRSLAACPIASRTARWLVLITFIAERIITIVTYFRLQVVKFIFGGRNSGQRRNEEDPVPSHDANERQGQPGARLQYPNLWTWDHGSQHLPRPPGCTFALQIRSGRRNRP
jgi:hypothetical protein